MSTTGTRSAAGGARPRRRGARTVLTGALLGAAIAATASVTASVTGTGVAADGGRPGAHGFGGQAEPGRVLAVGTAIRGGAGAESAPVRNAIPDRQAVFLGR